MIQEQAKFIIQQMLTGARVLTQMSQRQVGYNHGNAFFNRTNNVQSQARPMTTNFIPPQIQMATITSAMSQVNLNKPNTQSVSYLTIAPQKPLNNNFQQSNPNVSGMRDCLTAAKTENAQLMQNNKPLPTKQPSSNDRWDHNYWDSPPKSVEQKRDSNVDQPKPISDWVNASLARNYDTKQPQNTSRVVNPEPEAKKSTQLQNPQNLALEKILDLMSKNNSARIKNSVFDRLGSRPNLAEKEMSSAIDSKPKPNIQSRLAVKSTEPSFDEPKSPVKTPPKHEIPSRQIKTPDTIDFVSTRKSPTRHDIDLDSNGHKVNNTLIFQHKIQILTEIFVPILASKHQIRSDKFTR